jgi:hypothetical protein
MQVSCVTKPASLFGNRETFVKISALPALVLALSSLGTSAHAQGYDGGVECLAFIGVLEQAYGATPESTKASTGWRAYVNGVSKGNESSLTADITARSQTIMSTMAQKSTDRAAVGEYLGSFAAKCETPPPPPIKDAVCKSVSVSVRDGMDFLVSASAYNMTLQSGAEYEASRKEKQQAEARLAEAERAVAYYEGAPKASTDELMMLLKADNDQREAMLDQCIAQMK